MSSQRIDRRSNTSGLRIVVTGLIAQHRQLGGVAWDYLNFILGFIHLGHDVYYLEDSGQWPYNLNDRPYGENLVARDSNVTVQSLARIMSAFGLEDRWAYHFPISDKWFGMPDGKRNEIICSAELLINVSGTLEYPERYHRTSRLVYIDTDPVFTQINVAIETSELKTRVEAHDVHFTVGETVGKTFTNTGLQWIPTKHPIALSYWRTDNKPRNIFTTVMNWTSYEPIRFKGEAYGQKDIELLRFIDLPASVPGISLEIALAKTHHPKWQLSYEDLPEPVSMLLRRKKEWTPQILLDSKGWNVAASEVVCPDFLSYRRYIQDSKAEWSVAKNGYVKGCSGWFSGRSACYLAAGRPVVVQDTGFPQTMRTGEGVLCFRTPEESIAALINIEQNYRFHAEAALAIAEDYFDSNKVLTALIEKSI